MTDRKLGRAVEKCKHYRVAHTRERNKAKRILQSNDLEACTLYCRNHGILIPKISIRKVYVAE